jgi:hypothetical protein
MNVIEVLSTLKDYAVEYRKSDIVESVKRNSHMNRVPEDSKLTEAEAVAVVTDFINYIGMKNSVDCGLYTSDI